jgi:S1-C subfamily serine protease
MSFLLQQLDRELAGVVDQVRRSLVQLNNGRRGIGAGTIWHPSGLIVSNAHVVRPPRRGPWPVGRDSGSLSVLLPDGQERPVQLLAIDEELDLAALSVVGQGLPTIELGESSRLRPGEWVLAMGHPWGVEGAVSAGVVIGVGDQWAELPRRGREWIAASLQLRPGHSGGPMVDVRGRLVGINTMMAGPGVGVAVPVHVVKRFLKEHLGRQRQAA